VTVVGAGASARADGTAMTAAAAHTTTPTSVFTAPTHAEIGSKY
jgi:hypothetical protein